MRGGIVAVVVFVASFIVVFSSCERRRVDTSKVAAKVGDQVLTDVQLDLMVGGPTGGNGTGDDRWNAAERWLGRELLYREAVRRNVDKREGVLLQVRTATREIVINAMLEDMFRVELDISQQEIERYYAEHRTLFRRPETTIRLKHILLEGRGEARRLIRRLRRAPETFDDVARQRSADASSAEGGDLGYVSATTAYSSEIWQATLRMSAGEVSATPVKTEAGYHILKVVERRAEGSIKDIGEVQLDIANRVRAAKRWAHMTELVERLKLREPYELYPEQLGRRTAPYQTDVDSTLEESEAIESVD